MPSPTPVPRLARALLHPAAADVGAVTVASTTTAVRHQAAAGSRLVTPTVIATFPVRALAHGRLHAVELIALVREEGPPAMNVAARATAVAPGATLSRLADRVPARSRLGLVHVLARARTTPPLHTLAAGVVLARLAAAGEVTVAMTFETADRGLQGTEFCVFSTYSCVLRFARSVVR